MLLAHAVADHESVTELLRLGVLLPLALVACVAALARRLGARRSATVVALVAAGLLHLLLTRAHLREGPVQGAFFAASAVAELGLAVLVWRERRVARFVATIVVLEVSV